MECVSRGFVSYRTLLLSPVQLLARAWTTTTTETYWGVIKKTRLQCRTPRLWLKLHDGAALMIVR